MASAVKSMRLCLRAASRRAATPTTVAPRQCLTIRTFSSTPFPRHPATKKDDIDELEDEIDEIDEDEEIDPALIQQALADIRRDPDYESARKLQDRTFSDINGILSDAIRPPKQTARLFWADDEADTELIQDELDVDKFDEDDIMGMAHAKFEEFREYREYARIAAWQMPLLSKLATPFEPPTEQELLRFRYTSYMGEFHPAEKKVVVEFSPQDMPLDEAQQEKLRKLLGPRLNPETDIAKMSCEQFEHQAQNKRYLGDLVNKLVAQAKDPTDMFEDIPIDTRHHTFKTKPMFPKEWRMTEERRQFLEDTREKSLLLDQQMETNGTLVNGAEKIHAFFNAPQSNREIPEMAHARPSRSLPMPPARRNQQPMRR